MGAAFGAEFARHRALKIASRELFWRSLGIGKTADRHQHEHVGGTAREILALAAMALCLQHWLTLGGIADLAAIASAFQFHEIPPCLMNASPARMPRGRADR